jgi:hypothetical protein
MCRAAITTVSHRQDFRPELRLDEAVATGPKTSSSCSTFGDGQGALKSLTSEDSRKLLS